MLVKPTGTVKLVADAIVLTCDINMVFARVVVMVLSGAILLPVPMNCLNDGLVPLLGSNG